MVRSIGNFTICNIEFSLHLQLMVANKCKPARYTVAQALRILLQPEESSDLEDSDISDAESDHITEPSDHSDIESAEPAPDVQNADEPHVAPEPAPARGRVRGRGSRRGRGQGGGRAVSETDSLVPPQPDPAQTALVGRNGNVWQRHAPAIGRRRVQDKIRQPPGITNAAHCNSVWLLRYTCRDWSGSV